MVFRIQNALAMLAMSAIACSSASTTPAPYVPPAGDSVVEQSDGSCPSGSTALLRGTVPTGGACTEGADCAPVCCQCDNGTNRSWNAVHCLTKSCLDESDVCAQTLAANPDLCAVH